MKKIAILIFSMILLSPILEANNGDTISFYKKLIKPNYTDLDSNYQELIKNRSWKLVAKYERKFLFFRKFERIKRPYYVKFHDSIVSVKYGENGGYDVDFTFSDVFPHLIIFELGAGEDYAYQLLRFEDGYMVVNYIYISRKGRLKKSKKRLLFKLM